MQHSVNLINCISRRSLGQHNCYSLFKSVCNYSNGITKPTLAVQAAPDYLLANLKNATSSQIVLDLVGTHYKIMNSKQLIQALRSLFTLQKYNHSSESTEQLIKHPDFEKLCYSLKSKAGLIELNETLEALKVISYVGVPSNSTITQVLLQLLRHHVNDLSLSNIIFLDFLLRQFKSSSLVDGLLIALPVVFQANLPVKLDRDNLFQLTECFQYASKKNVSLECVSLIVNSLNKLIDFRGEIDAASANSIIWSICDMEPNDSFVPLFKKAIVGLLTQGLDKLDYKDVITSLSKISFKTSYKYMHYYSDTFYDSCANLIIDKDLGFEEAIYALLKFTRICHTNDNLLNYMCDKCVENPNLLTNAPPLHIYALSLAFAQSEYKPSNWKFIKNAIQSTTSFENYEKRDIIRLKLAASLCALDIFKFDVLEQALNDTYLKHILKYGYPADYENFFLTLQALNVFKPEYKHLLPEKSLVESFLSKVRVVTEYPLEGALQKALGGEDYVNTCAKTRLYHHVDHVIVMRKGGFPVPLPKNYQYIEDMDIPLNGYKVLVLALDSGNYTINTKRLKLTTLLKIKTLEAQGYHVIPVCMEVWERLQDFEQIPFIMQAIRLKIETQIEMANSVL